VRLFSAEAKSSRDLRTVRSSGAPLLESVACAVSFLLLFAWLAEGVFRGSSQQLDLRARAFVHQFATPSLTRVAQAVTFLGSFNFLAILFLIVTVVFCLLSLRRYAAWLATAMAGELLLEITLKSLFHRTRPETFFGRDPSGYSFPSGHAMGSFCFYGALAGLLCARIRQPSLRILIGTAATALVLAIGLSRIYLGVHYLTDVIAGYCVAGVWVSTLLFVALARRPAKHAHPRADA
jgi:undecaprenyl-diphosphatase